MLLRDIVKLFIPAKELKVRASNGQIKVNNEIVKDINIDINVTDEFVPLGNFIFSCLSKGMNSKTFNLISIKECFGEPINIKGLEFFENYVLISISKTDLFVFNKIK